MNDVQPLDDRWKLFAAEYCLDFTVSRAAERAQVPVVLAYAMIHDPRVVALVKDHKRRASDRVNISIDNTLEKLRMVADADVIGVLESLSHIEGTTLADRLRKLPLEVQYSIKGIKWTKNGPEIVMHDKLKAIELIGKYLGIFSDKLEVSGPGGTPVELITGMMTPKEAADAYARMLSEG
jgi:phage terminase small subunit